MSPYDWITLQILYSHFKWHKALKYFHKRYMYRISHEYIKIISHTFHIPLYSQRLTGVIKISKNKIFLFSHAIHNIETGPAKEPYHMGCMSAENPKPFRICKTNIYFFYIISTRMRLELFSFYNIFI